MDLRDRAHFPASPDVSMSSTTEEYVHICVPQVGEELDKYAHNFGR